MKGVVCLFKHEKQLFHPVAVERANPQYAALQQEQLLLMQTTMMQNRLEQIDQAETPLSIQRHDLRHRFHTLDAMPEKNEVQSAREYIASVQEILSETAVKRWCANPILDAVFSAYFKQAERKKTQIEADLDLPEDIQVDAVELSTVFANALENAIHAVQKLPEEQRIIRCKCIRHPQLMFRVSNPYQSEIQFDQKGFPIAPDTSHGLGTRSIAAYCEKHGATCEYRAKGGWFTIQIVQPIWTN